MGCLFDFVKQIFTEKQKSKEEKYYFNSIKIGLQKSISDINDTIKDIRNYDELINLNSEGIILEGLNEPKKDKKKDNLIQKQKNPYERPQYKDFYTFWSEHVMNSIILNVVSYLVLFVASSFVLFN